MQAQELTAREARQRLNETRHRNAPFEEKAREALELGEQYIGADNAHIARIDAETGHWEAAVSTDPEDEQFPEGLKLDLQTTYCRQTITADGPITLHDAPAQGWDDDPALESQGIHCYHGTTLYPGGDLYGTLCFVAENPRDDPFETDETMLADRISRLLEREIERQNHQAELTRRTNLVNVLNRVLRHNMRNDMSVIRGRTQLLADQLGEQSSANIVLDKIDGLIKLSEKAREAEELIDQNHTRQQTNLDTLIRGVVADVSAEYPAVSVTLDADPEKPVRVLPSFERAVHELVENAAKHGGESLSITVEHAPQTVEVRVADTGPGLSDNECKVLKTGVETPLIHGSGLGLWLVHWIVANHDGTVDATVTDTGTTMTVSVPRMPATDGTEDLADLKQATDQYQAAFDESFDAQLLLNDQARIIEANPAAERIFGLEQADFHGLRLAEFYPEGFDFDSCWSAFLDEGRNRDINTLSGPDSKPRRVEYSAVTDVVPGQHLFVARDVTERQQRKSELEIYETVLNSINNPAWVYDESKQVSFANQPNLDGLPFSNESLTGMPLSAFEHLFADPDTFETWDGLVDDVLAGAVVEDDLDVTFDVQGDPVVMNLRVAPIPDSDNPTGAAVIASDITERKQHERTLEGYETIHRNIPATGEPAGVRVLQVGHNPTIEESELAMLEREDSKFTVEIAPSASEGLESIDDCPPDCVVSEYSMSGMDGIEFLQAVREEHPDLPFILYTDDGSEAVASDAIAADVTGYLQRDRDGEQHDLLSDRIENAIEHSYAEQQAATTQRRLRELSEVTHDIHWMVTADWSEFLFVNSAYEDVFGRSRDDLLENPMDFLQDVHPADREMVTTAMTAASNGEPADFEFRVNGNGDVQRWVWVQAEPIYDETAEPTRIAGFVRDITERKERERTLTQMESIVQKMNDGAVIVQDGVIKYANPRLSELLDAAEDELIETPMGEFIAPEHRESVQERHQARVSGDETNLPNQYELAVLSADGQRIPVEVNISRIEYHGQPAAIYIVRDITERKRQQQKLDVEHSRANALFEQLGEPTVEVEFDDETPVIEAVNETFEQTFCVEETQLVGENLDEVLVPETDPSTTRSISRRTEAGEVVEEELELPTAAGERTFMLRTVPYALDGSQRAYAIYFDVTDGKRREERFQAFIEQSTDIITVLDPDGTYQYQSPSSSRILGRDADEVIGDDAFEFIHPDDRERVMATFAEAVSNPEMTPTTEYRFRHGDGSWIWIESIGNNQLDNPAIEGFVVNSRDITERKKREQRVQRERDRLDKFAGTVSHDLRNPLNVAQLRLKLAQDDCESEHLDIVERAHGRMEQLIEDVLTLARAGEEIGETDIVELNSLTEDCWQNVETNGAELIGETKASIQADKNQLKQLIENLLRNAIEHVESDVSITIGDISGGFYIEDNGPGIPASDRSDAFNPGFSTSEAGTGFGLSIVQDIAEAHGWTIAVTEGSAGGARFEFSIPSDSLNTASGTIPSTEENANEL